MGQSYIDPNDPKRPLPEKYIPKGLQYQEIFRIEKSENHSHTRYYVFFNPSKPEKPVDVKVFWYWPEEGYTYGEINWIEQRFAYGIRIEKKN